MLRAEYGKATDGQTNGTEIDRDGFYVSALYTFAKQFRLGARYEEYDQNNDVDNDELSIITGGFHYMIKGKNINLKAEWYGIDAGRPQGQQRPRRDVQPVRPRRPGRLLAPGPGSLPRRPPAPRRRGPSSVLQAAARSASATSRSFRSRGTLFCPPSLPRSRIQAWNVPGGTRATRGGSIPTSPVRFVS